MHAEPYALSIYSGSVVRSHSRQLAIYNQIDAEPSPQTRHY
jgi:hypothetical protein